MLLSVWQTDQILSDTSFLNTIKLLVHIIYIKNVSHSDNCLGLLRLLCTGRHCLIQVGKNLSLCSLHEHYTGFIVMGKQHERCTPILNRSQGKTVN